jgi:serine/threonine-protein kinase
MLTDCPALIDALREHRLLEPAQLEAIAAGQVGAGAPDAATPVVQEPQALAAELVRRGWLTAYQAEEVLAGRADKLVLRDYVLLDRLGEGGMGQVFKARHRVMKNVQAVKLIRKEQMAHPQAVERFYLEVQAVAKLHHPNIVLAHNAGQEGETHFFVMEYVAGTDLGRLLLRDGPLPVPVACEYARQAALGLQHAHERGLVHRDVKPSNLLLAEGGQVKVLDLGLARVRQVEDSNGNPFTALTAVGVLMGTPDYIAPEQAQDSRAVDIGADVYSLGCTLYHLLTGQPPYPGGSAMDKVLKHVSPAPVPDVRLLRPDVPGGLAAVVNRMTAKDRAARFQTPAEVAAALEPFCRPDTEASALPRPADISPVSDTTDAVPASSGQSTVTHGVAPSREDPRTDPTRNDHPPPTVPHPAPDELVRETQRERRPKRGFKAIVLGVLLLAGIGGASGVAARWLWPQPTPPTGGSPVDNPPAKEGTLSRDLEKVVEIIEPKRKPVVSDSPIANNGNVGKGAADEWREKLADVKSSDQYGTVMLARPRSWARAEAVGYSFDRVLKKASIAAETGRVVAATEDATILIQEMHPEAPAREIELPSLLPNRIPTYPSLGDVAITPDGRHAALVTAAKRDPLKLQPGEKPTEVLNALVYWELSRGSPTLQLHYGNVTLNGTVEYSCIALSPDGRTALIGGRGTHVAVADLTKKDSKITGSIRHDSQLGIVALAISSDGSFAVSVGGDKTVCVHDLKGKPDGPPYRLGGMKEAVTCVAFSSENKYLLLGASDKVYIWELGENLTAHQVDVLVLRKNIEARTRVTCLACAPRDDYFLVGYSDGRVALGKLGTSEAIWTEWPQWRDPRGERDSIYVTKMLALAFPSKVKPSLSPDQAVAYFIADNLVGKLHYLLEHEGVAKKAILTPPLKEEMELGTAKH